MNTTTIDKLRKVKAYLGVKNLWLAGQLCRHPSQVSRLLRNAPVDEDISASIRHGIDVLYEDVIISRRYEDLRPVTVTGQQKKQKHTE